MSFEAVAGPGRDLWFSSKRLLLGPARVRRTRLYGVGAPKSGTHSIVSIFSGNVRARHHPGAPELIDKILAWHAGRLSEPAMAEWLRARDRRLSLEVDSAPLNFEILDLLVREFTDARFVLTLRDCYSWVDSLANHIIRFRGETHERWIRMREWRFRPEAYQHAPAARWLEEEGFYPLESYLAYWARHNEAVLARVPAERLFIVKTTDIGLKAFEIADFAGLPRRAVRPGRGQAYRNPAKQAFVRRLDRDLLEATVDAYCRPLMRTFFPDIKSLDDVKV
jgi:hypothetical protein